MSCRTLLHAVIHFLSISCASLMTKNWGQHKYIFSNNKKTFNETNAYCTERGNMISILSAAENQFVIDEGNSREYWLGITTSDPECKACNKDNINVADCNACRSKWYWLDGSRSNYTMWSGREPSGDGYCARIESNELWWDISCSPDVKFYALCKQHLCDLTDCGLHETCHAANGQATCECRDGYSGTPCTEINECDEVQCENSGTCIDEIANYTCLCAQGYNGRQCEIDVNECESNPCQNNGTCDDRPGQFVCECTEGYEGIFCDRELDFTQVQSQDQNSLSGLWIALYVGIVGCTLSFIVLLYFVFTDHAVRTRLKRNSSPKRQHAKSNNLEEISPTPSTSQEIT